MRNGTVLLLGAVAAALLGFGVFRVTLHIHQYLFPPVVVVNGIAHPVMPTASLLTGLFSGIVASVGTGIVAYRRLRKN